MGKRKSYNEHIEDCKKVHGGIYKYPEEPDNFNGVYTELKIICTKHGEFTQSINNHKNGSGCKVCGRQKTISAHIMSYAKHIEDCKKVHKNYYTYPKHQDLPDRTGTKIKIVCPVHGEFNQALRDHKSGHGCSKCYFDKMGINQTLTYEQHILKCKEVHDNFYRYPEHQDLPKGYKSTIKIICPAHGVFTQILNDHKDGHGCQTCGIRKSGGESEIKEWLLSLDKDLELIEDFSIKDSDKKLELDLYLPEYNLGIEYHGLYWHSTKFRNKNYHREKYNFFKEHDIQVIQIFENEWKLKKDIVKSIIKSKLKINNILYARKCIIKEISGKDYREFLVNNHIQGFAVGKVKIGLFYEDRLVQVMSFSKSRYNGSYDWENIRTCSKLNTTVIGGFSKILKYFSSKYEGSIISYIDLRYFDGKSYISNGFSQINVSQPNYFYWKNDNSYNLLSRVQFQKHKLKDKLEIFNSDLTEVENMEANGYLRIFDAGNLVVVKE